MVRVLSRPERGQPTMTRQTYPELYDDAQRLNPEVVEAMREWHEDHPETPWGAEYEIPAETNGWVYYGDCGSAAVSTNWADRFPEPTQAVGVHITPTHPQDETPDLAEAFHVDDMGDKIDSRTVFASVEGEPYRTPLYVSRRMFWEMVEAAIEWMEEHPP